MKNAHGTYDSPHAMQVSLEKVKAMFGEFGVKRIYIKSLAPNDNSKNQPYFGAHLPDVAFLPSGELIGERSTSAKDKKREILYKAKLSLSWFDVDGYVHPAPNAKLIYYPQYPEVRFSGFLLGSGVKAGEWMDPKKSGRSLGRWLLLGVAPNQTIYAYLAIPECRLARQLEGSVETTKNVFGQMEVRLATTTNSDTAQQSLIRKLKEIHQRGWIPSQRLQKGGVSMPYKAANGGGYTLEALLGIIPNGYADPDYMGWEIKQFSVSKFPLTGAKVTTLFTPEPDGGVYTDPGFIEFMKKFGYPDQSGIPDRINFGGTHYFGKRHARTGLTLCILGFDMSDSTIQDPNGYVALIDENKKVAASWSFSKIMNHWKRKHAQAAYIPCLKKKDSAGIHYLFGNNVELGTGTSFEMLLSSISKGGVYYDPGLKLEGATSSNPKSKRRNQFRVKHQNLKELYGKYENISL